MNANELKKILELHALFLVNDPRGKRADLRNADLRNADLEGVYLRNADLGSSTFLGCALRLLGACQDSVEWLDQQDHSDLTALRRKASPEFRGWLAERKLTAKKIATFVASLG